jgi:hypothetical protein
MDDNDYIYSDNIIINKGINKQIIAKQEEEELGTIKEENSLIIENNSNNLVKNQNYGVSSSTNINTLMKPKPKQNKLNINEQQETKIRIMNHFSIDKTKLSFKDIPNQIIIKQMLFYLDINQLPRLSSVSRKAYECVKTHMFIRIFYLNKEKKIIEQENEQIIKSIEAKRQEFFDEYEINKPSKENALMYFKQITYQVSSISLIIYINRI